jgi:hypothetical protein
MSSPQWRKKAQLAVRTNPSQERRSQRKRVLTKRNWGRRKSQPLCFSPRNLSNAHLNSADDPGADEAPEGSGEVEGSGVGVEETLRTLTD